MAHTIRRVIPLLNRVLVQRIEIPKTSAGGIILPDKADSEM
jgi:co-chaperonin GroES (HSP10)